MDALANLAEAAGQAQRACRFCTACGTELRAKWPEPTCASCWFSLGISGVSRSRAMSRSRPLSGSVAGSIVESNGPNVGHGETHCESKSVEPVAQCRRRCTDVSGEDSDMSRASTQNPEAEAVLLVEALLSSPDDVATQLSKIAKLAEIACTPDGGSAWRAGAIGPCVSALSRFSDVAIAWKACAVLQFIASHSEAAAADCVKRGAVGAMASRLVRCDDSHSKAFEMRWRALMALQTLCAADCPTGAVASTQFASSAGMEAQLRAILASADHDTRNELLLEPAVWLLDKVLGS